MHATVINTVQENLNYKFINLKPYTKYEMVVKAFNVRHEGEASKICHATAYRDVPTETFTNLHVSFESTETVAALLKWNAPNDCSTITGPIKASKLFIRKLNSNFTEYTTTALHFPLNKSLFRGLNSYEVRLHTLRDLDKLENKTAYLTLLFTVPARAPPPVRDVNILEIDLYSQTITLKWEAPLPPLDGKLQYYSVSFLNEKNKYQNKDFIIHLNESCNLWASNKTLCKTLPLPTTIYNQIQIRSHNEEVTEASKPVITYFERVTFAPTAPTKIHLSIIEYTLINISWNHPAKTGGRLDKFIIEAHIIHSNLKTISWEKNISIFEVLVDEYQPQYNAELNLLPSTTFSIFVKAVTIDGLYGPRAQSEIIIPRYINFSTDELKFTLNNNGTISIIIPAVYYDVKNSILFIIVESQKYCNDGNNNYKNIQFYLDTMNLSKNKTTWKAATLKKPELYKNRKFEIGDGEIYGDSKNFALCPRNSYVIHLLLVDATENRHNDKNKLKNILKAVKTKVIYIEEPVKIGYGMWIITFLFIVIMISLPFFLVFRKKIFNRFTSNNENENVPLSSNLDQTTIITQERNSISNNKLDEEFTMPVKIQDFTRYFESAFKSRKLEQEYAAIANGPIKPSVYGSQIEMKPKNRYAKLYPYDETRVILEKLQNDPCSDYINANFISGFGEKTNAYIATQGPKPNTVIDFWRMAWQEKVRIICMMTNLVENEKVKCEQYWPSSVRKQIMYGTISVCFLSEKVHTDYILRTFQIWEENQERRTIEQLHYTAWPDHGVPLQAHSLVVFLKEIQKHSPACRRLCDPPIIVHCSAGVGRTGTLIVLDMSICRAVLEEVTDVHKNILSVRNDRINMVDNIEQYLLIHLVLVEYFNSENTCISCDTSLLKRVKEAKNSSYSQYQRILDTTWRDEILHSSVFSEKSLSNRNIAKHRFPEFASIRNRVYIKRSVTTDEDSDFIAATWVKNIFKDCQYITTQLPMPTTTIDFWRMLSEQNVEYVLSLQLPNLQDSTYCELVPENQNFCNTTFLKVIYQKKLTMNSQNYFKEEVLIIDSSKPTKKQIVKIISYKNWPVSSLPSSKEVVKLWKFFEQVPSKDKHPVVIVCCNGVTICGLWLAASFLLKRMSLDNECNVPQAVRAIRKCRTDFLNEPKHLEYLYEVAMAWDTEK